MNMLRMKAQIKPHFTNRLMFKDTIIVDNIVTYAET